MEIYQFDSYLLACRKAANLISAQVILVPKSVLGLMPDPTLSGVYRQLSHWYRRDDLSFSEATAFALWESAGSEPISLPCLQADFLDAVDLKNVHVPKGSGTPESACEDYDAAIAAAGGLDVQLLTVGMDGSIGPIHPGSAFSRKTHLMNEVGSGAPVCTMGLGTIMLARKLVVLVCGKRACDALQRALCGPVTPDVPASILQLHPNVVVVTTPELPDPVTMEQADLAT